ncbi:WAS/WASL-interacting protein family member 1-like [Ipomoea triloba]|uniref:WAS/WASL-interacting protein family member 1-like n=1 Tax=Ipomoea triloba TaxID=35885 RepID=UPI00125E3920|nr:WAS/WASL-interacting protein family member 1-like [Ipomoea triloba]
MDVPGITRDHVASHLQKYRMLLRRVSELTMPAPRRYGVNNLQTSLGGGAGRWNNNITAPMPPAGTFSSSSSFLFSDPPPPPRLAVASPPCNQPSWRPGYGTGGRQSSLLLSPHHHHQLFNFGLQSSPLIPAASTNMVDPIYQRSFTSLPPLVIPGNNDDAIAAASPRVPTLQLHGGGGGSSMLQPPPQTYNINNATGGDETSSLKLPARLGLTAPLSTEFSMFDMMMSFFADDDDHQLDGGGLQATHEDLIIHNNDCENQNSNFSNSSSSNAVKNVTTTTTQYYDQDLPSLDQLMLLEPRNDEELFLQSVFASMPSVGAAQQHHTSNN